MKRFLKYCILVLVLLPIESASAEILNPYLVDEKPRVVFSDSLLVSTYFGLENYTQDYVGGYLHITFTYTHARCCYASYPPVLYVTNVDPRTTATPIVKWATPVYHMFTTPFTPFDTDWYLYDVQLDATGYTVVIKQAGVTEVINEYRPIPGLASSDWVSLANFDPNSITLESMAFTPVPLKDTPPRTPVIIVPGIMGSYLDRDDGTEVWMNLLKMLLPGDDSYLDELKLSDVGEPVNSPPLKPTDILREVLTKDFFDGMINHLESIGYQEGIDLFVFPYDWRLDVSISAEKLSEKIIQIKSQTGAQKVDIVAHSMGGLVAKQYLKSYGDNSIDKFVDIGTPQIGSPNAFKVLSYGDNLGFNFQGKDILNQERAKTISQNMPSIYELLPTREYFSLYPFYVSDLDDLDNNGVRGNLNYGQTKIFLKNTGRNGLLVDRADTFHQEIDNLNSADYGVKTYNIVGCGTETLGKIFILNKEDSGGVEYNISYVNGDGTVPLKSAEAIPALKTYYVKNATHALMPSTSGVKELVAGILASTSTEDFDISPYNNLATTATGCTIPNGKIVSFHSPIELHIYSGDNHVGPNSDGDIENNIPGVSYDVIDGNKFAFLPDGADYLIKGLATASSTFNARIETVQNEVTIETRYFNQVPITPNTQVELTNASVLIDNESDGIFESVFPVSSVLDENQSSDVTKPVTSVTVVGKRKRDEPYTAPVKVTLIATDDNSGVLKTEYSVNSEQNWIPYLTSFTVNTKGTTHLLYRSTDRAGNIETPKFVDIEISRKSK